MGVLNNNWAPDLEQRLRDLVAEGVNRGRIAEMLGQGITRNAVIGKCQRLGLCETRKPKPLPAPKKASHPKPKLPKSTPTNPFRGLPLLCRETAFEVMAPASMGLALLDLKSRQCRCIGDGGYCGHRVDGHRSWCAHHARLVYKPAKRRAA